MNTIVILLTITICCGIIYRIMFLSLFVELNNSFGAMDIAFSDSDSMDTESNLTGEENYQELVLKVNGGVGDLNQDHLLDIYEKVDEEHKKEMYDSLKVHYLDSVNFASKDESNVWGFVADIYSKFLGINKEKFLKKLQSTYFGKQFKTISILTKIFYFIFILSFLSSLIIFTIGL